MHVTHDVAGGPHGFGLILLSCMSRTRHKHAYERQIRAALHQPGAYAHAKTWIQSSEQGPCKTRQRLAVLNSDLMVSSLDPYLRCSQSLSDFQHFQKWWPRAVRARAKGWQGGNGVDWQPVLNASKDGSSLRGICGLAIEGPLGAGSAPGCAPPWKPPVSACNAVSSGHCYEPE